MKFSLISSFLLLASGASATSVVSLPHSQHSKETSAIAVTDGEFDNVATAFHLLSDLVRRSYLRGIVSDENLDKRDEDWLLSHNAKRKTYHKAAGKTYVPLVWSSGLKDSAQAWADKLAKNCKLELSGTDYGENLVGKTGTTIVWDTDAVLDLWENKLENNRPDKGMMIQVLWRPTKYVGCADASSSAGSSKKCTYSVCHYAKPGNCNLGNGDWQDVAFADDSRCKPECPPEGCD